MFSVYSMNWWNMRIFKYEERQWCSDQHKADRLWRVFIHWTPNKSSDVSQNKQVNHWSIRLPLSTNTTSSVPYRLDLYNAGQLHTVNYTQSQYKRFYCWNVKLNTVSNVCKGWFHWRTSQWLDTCWQWYETINHTVNESTWLPGENRHISDRKWFHFPAQLKQKTSAQEGFRTSSAGLFKDFMFIKWF